MGSGRSKQPKNSSSYDLDNNKFDSNAIVQPSTDKLHTKSPLTMPNEITFKCDRCGMIFPTDEALFKHRTRFCIGIIDSGTGRKAYYSDDEDINESNNLTNRSTSRKLIRHQLPVEKKREEINEWKNQRSIIQSVQDMEDRILRDSQKTQRLANDLKKRTHDYNQILIDYEQLQAHERDLLRQMFNIQGQSGSHLNQPNSLNDFERNQLETLQRQNARLEEERRVIQNKLEELIANNYQSSPPPNYEPYRLLRDMKDEQEQNEKTLMHLRRRLFYPKSSLLTSSDIPTLPYLSPSRRSTGDNIRYLQSRGLNTEVLSRSPDLERRLRHNEFYPWLKDYPEPLRHYFRYRPIEIPNEKLIFTKNENQRLQNELDNMERRFEKLDSRTRQLELTIATSGGYDSKLNDFNSYSTLKLDRYPSIKSLNNTSPRQTYTNYDNDSVEQHRQYYQTSLPTVDRHDTSHVPQPIDRYNTNMRRLQDPLAPQPYDPIGGFVIFFDFITHIPSTIDQCRLITCLHHPQSGLGEPSQLQPFKCEPYVDETNGERMNIVLIATKQPVPSCPPQPTLTIVIEIQVTTKHTSNDILRTQGWLKFPLFDHRNRLLSGRWKVPLKALPIHQDESFAVISTLPTLGRAELHYRLVNLQDAAEQSNAPLSPKLRDLYFYPPQYRNRSYM